MSRARDQLISDWRQELAAAEAVVAGSGRAAWLARVRRRLYRFLLACYGTREWTDGPPVVDDGRNAREESHALFESADALDVPGKPAKTGGQIRSVLKKVASAQDHPPGMGPLAQGLSAESWVVVAAASSKLRTGRCWELLRAAGLHARTSYRGDDHMVEVPACERQEAFAIIERHRDRIHAPPKTPRTQRVPLWCRLAAMAILTMWVTILLAVSMSVGIWALTAPHQPQEAMLTSPEFYHVWGSLFVALFLLFSLGMLRRNRPLPSAGKATGR